MLVGPLGAAHNRRTTVMGEAVDVAARIEAANKEVGSALLVSAAVEARLGLRFARGRRAELPLKGTEGVHRLVEIRSAEAGLDADGVPGACARSLSAHRPPAAPHHGCRPPRRGGSSGS